tara:strand:+ start:1222 stop:1527 length:306 start_codon:yes stop_codon:yes gene_type:complete
MPNLDAGMMRIAMLPLRCADAAVRGCGGAQKVITIKAEGIETPLDRLKELLEGQSPLARWRATISRMSTCCDVVTTWPVEIDSLIRCRFVSFGLESLDSLA